MFTFDNVKNSVGLSQFFYLGFIRHLYKAYVQKSQSWRRGTECDCKIDWLWVRSPVEEIKYSLTFIFHFFALVSRQSAALSSASQHAMPQKLGGKWETVCLNTSNNLCLPCCVRDTVG